MGSEMCIRDRGYRDLMKYFIELENNQNHENQYHGNFGSLWVETYEPILDASRSFLNACEKYGLHKNNDFNGENQEGFGNYQVNIKNGKRFSASDAFLKPALDRSNLHLLTNTLVEKIITSNKKAIGVKVKNKDCLLYTSPSPRDGLLSRMPSSA